MIRLKFQVALFLILSLFINVCLAVKSDNQANSQPKLLALSGSIRSDSYNTKALKLLVEAAKKEGASISYIDLADYPLPIYNGDLEAKQGVPDNAKKLQDLIASHDGLLIASPEYNGLPSPLLINTIDWTSREVEGKKNSGVKIFKGKVAALIAASPGKSGGGRSLSVLTQMLTNIGVKVVPAETAIPNAYQAFDGNGQLKDAALTTHINNQAKSMIQIIKAR